MALRNQYSGRINHNNLIAVLLLLVTVGAPFMVPDGWIRLILIVAQVPLAALAILVAGPSKP